MDKMIEYWNKDARAVECTWDRILASVVNNHTLFCFLQSSLKGKTKKILSYTDNSDLKMYTLNSYREKEFYAVNDTILILACELISLCLYGKHRKWAENEEHSNPT